MIQTTMGVAFHFGKKNPLLSEQQGICLIKFLAVTYFHMGNPTLSSAHSVFTSEFGMGSGGTRLLWPPEKRFDLFQKANS